MEAAGRGRGGEKRKPSLLSPPPPRTFLRPPQFSRGQKSEKCIKRAESLTETLATQASERRASGTEKETRGLPRNFQR